LSLIESGSQRLPEPLDLENTLEEDLRDLNDQADVVEYLADPYQFHRSLTTLQAAGLPINEFPQTTANCTLMGQTLFDLLNGQNLVLYADDELRQQALSTVSIETPRGGESQRKRHRRRLTLSWRYQWLVWRHGSPWRAE
jgi:phage terminase large subunit-like protein